MPPPDQFDLAPKVKGLQSMVDRICDEKAV